ncbi:hypothetical protein EYC80_009870 [Monilinia laxa]|uniref:Uncharacterized protein n=1 Tax=Monilinia laxa TaxID=61186 RepID=A0A5N6JQZ0_MONLA|nr:hypothetical protein EYC80_009870 [Monilinia laxa]
MELTKPNLRELSAEKKLPCTEIHPSNSGYQTTSERKIHSPEDTIMYEKNHTNQSNTSDSPTSDGYDADDESYGNHPISHRPSFELALRAQGPHPKYVPAPRRRKGILDPLNVGDDIAFFAGANRQFQQRMRDIVHDKEMKAKKEVYEAMEEKEALLKAATKASKDINFLDIF